MRILILPTRWESRAALRSLPGALPEPEWDVPTWRVGNLLIVEPGIGPELMAALLPHVESLGPHAVWLFGWCGGLTPELRVGDLVLADATILSERDHDLATRISHPPPDPLLAQVRCLAEKLNLQMIVGPVLTSDHLLTSVEEKRTATATGAVAVEMEAGPLALWTATRCLPFIHLRIVLDPLVSPLPSTRLLTDEHRRVSRRALLFHALTHPRDWSALWNLIRQARAAGQVTADVIAALTQPDCPLYPKEIEN